MLSSFTRLLRASGQFVGMTRPSLAKHNDEISLSNFSALKCDFSNAILGGSGVLCNRTVQPSEVSKTISNVSGISIGASNLFQQSNRSHHYRYKYWEPIMEKVTLEDGKRTTVRMVPERFFRLHWGMWIRRRAGARNKMWAKSTRDQKKMKKHVMCNATQCRLLDKMVGPSYRKRTYFVDDPYAPYHEREEFWATRRKPVDIPPRL